MSVSWDIVNDALSGEPEYTKRDEDLVARCLEHLRDEKDYIVARRSHAVVIRDGEPEGLPAPRLQIRWEPAFTDARSDDATPWVAHYELIIPVRPLDCRATDILTKNTGLMCIPLGCTSRTGGGRPVREGVVDTPFRDGIHMNWDAEALNLPKYAICGEVWTRIEKENG